MRGGRPGTACGSGDLSLPDELAAFALVHLDRLAGARVKETTNELCDGGTVRAPHLGPWGGVPHSALLGVLSHRSNHSE
ncbi:MAG: hypothetical protein JO331_11575 [Verrucomicrobia bacterium]|nr:hypothetical protein [Verrucomicrobiota bacterium]